MKIRLIGFTCLLFLLTSCWQPMPENDNIPYASVSFVIDCSLSGSDYQLASGNWATVKTYDSNHPALHSPEGRYGYCGVAVARAMDDQLYAFDLCCPYEAKKDVVLKMDGFFLVCPKCHSKFDIGNGFGLPINGPATKPLKTYLVQRYSHEMYRVRNK